MGERGLDPSGLGPGGVVECCEYGNELSVFIKCREYLGQLRKYTYHLVNMESAT